jgi:glycosyltransferase involved in cell wall biosynthesis
MPVLLMVGDGELRPALEKLASEVAPGAVKFLGFQNQTRLPALYDLCDAFVLPSVFEPWGLVVNEVMNAGKPVIVSDQVGSGADLVEPGVNGEVFRAGGEADLAAKLRPWLVDAEKRQQAGAASLRRINEWGFVECCAGLKQALADLKVA